MAKCEICSKDTVFGNNVSHSIRKTNRSWKPNIKKVRVIDKGTPKTIKVCSRCLRSNKVTRAV
ncbi:MAG: 50S ribosomal protein L28 [Clostridiaceae bacterium]|jgi:large subunit ribosomal protein L28|nr:50S ribosomal protein L28 [Clostridiaceae bacterium]